MLGGVSSLAFWASPDPVEGRLWREVILVPGVVEDDRKDYVLNHGGHRDHGDRTKETGGKDMGLHGLASWRRGTIPFISVPSVISVVRDLLVPAAGRAGRIREIRVEKAVPGLQSKSSSR